MIHVHTRIFAGIIHDRLLQTEMRKLAATYVRHISYSDLYVCIYYFKNSTDFLFIYALYSIISFYLEFNIKQDEIKSGKTPVPRTDFIVINSHTLFILFFFYFIS